MRQTHSFYPSYPAPPSGGLISSAVPSTDGRAHVSQRNPARLVATTSATTTATTVGGIADDDEDSSNTRNNVALFGDLPEAKRRKFILVDDAQRGTRVRVRVMLDQVRMAEMPDSYRKNNSVYPRSWFATEMQSPPTSPRRGRWPDDVDGSEAAATMAQTLVPVPTLDGSDAKLPVPRMTRTKRSKEVTLNDLGYRMSWSQSRVFSGRTLFLQRSCELLPPPFILYVVARSADKRICDSGCVSQQDAQYYDRGGSGCAGGGTTFRDEGGKASVDGQGKEIEAR
jgi:hypothetical protein